MKSIKQFVTSAVLGAIISIGGLTARDAMAGPGGLACTIGGGLCCSASMCCTGPGSGVCYPK